MFTGIVEHMGTVVEIQQLDTSSSGGGGWSMKVGDSEKVLVDCRLGDSISVNGMFILNRLIFDSLCFGLFTDFFFLYRNLFDCNRI